MKNMPGLSAVALVLGLASSGLTVQDPVKLEPSHYKVEFENDQVRVLRITQDPHEKGVMHSHSASVIVFLTDMHARFTYPDGKTEEVRARAGQTRWAGPVTHQVENLADTPSEVLHIEVRTGAAP